MIIYYRIGLPWPQSCCIMHYLHCGRFWWKSKRFCCNYNEWLWREFSTTTCLTAILLMCWLIFLMCELIRFNNFNLIFSEQNKVVESLKMTFKSRITRNSLMNGKQNLTSLLFVLLALRYYAISLRIQKSQQHRYTFAYMRIFFSSSFFT